MKLSQKHKANWGLCLSLWIGWACLFCANPALAKKYDKILLPKELKTNVNGLLKVVGNLHSACITNDKKQEDLAIRLVINHLSIVGHDKKILMREYAHLGKIVKSAKDFLIMSQERGGEKRRKSLAGFFRQIVQLTQMYKADRYRVFFCPRDKAVWLQKSARARNPIHPRKFKVCGRAVR